MIRKVRFLTDQRSPATGNWHYMAGSVVDFPQRQADTLIAEGVAVAWPPEPQPEPQPEPEPEVDFDSMTMAQLRKMAAGYSVKLASRKADLIANIKAAM